MFKFFLCLLILAINLAYADLSIEEAVEHAKAVRTLTDSSKEAEQARQSDIMLSTLREVPDFGDHEKLEAAISLFAQYAFPDQELHVVNSKETSFFGKSNDEVFFVRDRADNLHSIVKAFHDPETVAGRFLPELSGMALLNERDMETCQGVKPITVGKCRWKDKNYGLLMETVAPGIRANEFIVQASLEDAAQMFRAIGKAFAELHRNSDTWGMLPPKIVKKLDEKYQNLFDPATLALLEGKLDLHMLRVEVERVLQEAVTLTFPLHYQHGDPNLKNIFYDQGTEKITFIDLGKMHYSIAYDSSPLLDGAYDLVRIQESLVKNMQSYLTDKEIKILCNALLEGYRAAGGQLDEQLSYFYTLSSKIGRLKSYGDFDYLDDPVLKEQHRLTFESSLRYLQQLNSSAR